MTLSAVIYILHARFKNNNYLEQP